MNRQQKIDTINEMIAKKNLSFGCKIFHKVESWKRWFKARIITDSIKRDDWIFYWVKLDSENSVTWLQKKEMEIIGHPVMIGDVIDYINEDISMGAGYDQVFYHSWESVVDTIKLWEEKRKPIEEQSDKCINFIYSLISK